MKLKSREKELLKKFLLAIKGCFSTMEESTFWPANAAQIEAYFSDIIALDLFGKFKENPQKFKEALNTLRAFTLYASLYHTEIVGLKVTHLYYGYPKNRREIVDFVFSFFDVIESKVKNGLFCLDGTHRILSKEEVERIDKGERWVEAKNSTIKKEIANLIASLENLVWAFYFDPFVCAGREIHGPYPISKNEVILVRDYFNLNPKEIWEIKNKYQSIKMYLKYPKSLNIKLDYANHLKSSKPLGDNLLSFSIKVEGKQLSSLTQIHSLSKYFLYLGEKQADKVNTLSPLEILKKGAEIYYYRYKNFFEYYKEDWHPPSAVYERINKLKLKWWNIFKSDLRKRKSPQFYVKLFDPRNNFIG
jgi:hypothetical protein